MMSWLRNFLRIFPSLFLGVLTALLFLSCHSFDQNGGHEYPVKAESAHGAEKSEEAESLDGVESAKAESPQVGNPPPTTPAVGPESAPVLIPALIEVIKLESRQATQPDAESPQGGVVSADFILPEIPEQIDPPSMHSAEFSIMRLKHKEKKLEVIDPEEVELEAAQSVLKKRVKEGSAAILKASKVDQGEGEDRREGADWREVTDRREWEDNTRIRVQPEEKEKSYSKNGTEVYAPYYGQAALSASPPLEVEKPLERVRDMWARRGDRVEISFGNRGWVFLGLRDSRELKGLIFLGSKELGGKVIFHFRSEDYGVYLLEFQLQDNRTATVKNESVRLSVVTLEEFDSRLASAAIEMPDKGEGERFLLAEKLYGLGQYEAALKEYISGYREGLPLVNDRIASIYLQSGEYQAAAKFYEKNRLSGGELGEKAVIGLVRSYLALEDSIKLLGLLDKFLGLEYLSIEEDLMHLIHYEIEHGEPTLTYELLTEYVSGFPRGVFLDEVYFLFGQLFEGESPYRDLERSKEYYLRVYEEFPISGFSEEARERVKYLERYFFYIR